MQYRTVNDIKLLTTRDKTWRTKFNGDLEVLFKFSADELNAFLDINNRVFKDYSTNIRGLRLYSVSNLRKGAIGAGEWHKARTEYVSVVSGAIKWTCRDIDGGKKEVFINRNTAVITPPTIMHTYEALEDDVIIQVLANTLFIPGSPDTYDTYSMEDFDFLVEERKTPR